MWIVINSLFVFCYSIVSWWFLPGIWVKTNYQKSLELFTDFLLISTPLLSGWPQILLNFPFFRIPSPKLWGLFQVHQQQLVAPSPSCFTALSVIHFLSAFWWNLELFEWLQYWVESSLDFVFVHPQSFKQSSSSSISQTSALGRCESIDHADSNRHWQRYIFSHQLWIFQRIVKYFPDGWPA